MAEEGDSGEKTEAPTSRRVSEARKEGQVGVSTDLSNVLGITGAYLALQYISPALWHDILQLVRGAFTSELSTEPITARIIQQQTVGVIALLLPEMLTIMFIAAFCGAGCTALQTKFLWSWALVKPKMRNINPLSGVKRIVGIGNVVNVFKSMIKLAIIVPISYVAFFDLFPLLTKLMDVPISQLLPFTAYCASYIFWRLITWLLILAIFDVIWQKYNTYRQQKMSKQEIKDEKKSVEGDEATRKRIIQMGLQRARERMFTAVPTADVIVTNPTHIAVALCYSSENGGAPRVVAKGQGHVAKRIRELGRENSIPIIERKPLARALYKMVEIGHEIPYELFKAVAELLAYVYRLKGKVPDRARKNTEHETVNN